MSEESTQPPVVKRRATILAKKKLGKLQRLVASLKRQLAAAKLEAAKAEEERSNFVAKTTHYLQQAMDYSAKVQNYAIGVKEAYDAIECSLKDKCGELELVKTSSWRIQHKMATELKSKGEVIERLVADVKTRTAQQHEAEQRAEQAIKDHNALNADFIVVRDQLLDFAEAVNVAANQVKAAEAKLTTMELDMQRKEEEIAYFRLENQTLKCRIDQLCEKAKCSTNPPIASQLKQPINAPFLTPPSSTDRGANLLKTPDRPPIRFSFSANPYSRY